MTRTERPERSGGLSLTTLLLASLSSATAALVVSRFWEGGTVVSAAVTPVLVALVSEALRRPTQRLGEAARPLADAARPRSRKRTTAADEVPRFGDEGPPPRLYGGRRVRVQAVLITAVLAFVIAAAALTLPELLVLDRSVAGGQDRTTYFGGKASPRAERDGDKRPAKENEQQTQSTTTTETAPDTETAPPGATTTPTTPAEPPATTAPTQPAPEGGQPAPPAPTTPSK